MFYEFNKGFNSMTSKDTATLCHGKQLQIMSTNLCLRNIDGSSVPKSDLKIIGKEFQDLL